MYKEYFSEFLDTTSSYYKKMIDLIDKNENMPKVVVKNRNLHHIVPRFYWKRKNLPVDNSMWNFVSLSIGDHFLIHYYMDKCALDGWHKYTSPCWRYIIKGHLSEVCEWLSKDEKNIEFFANVLSIRKDDIVIAKKKRKKSKKS